MTFISLKNDELFNESENKAILNFALDIMIEPLFIYIFHALQSKQTNMTYFILCSS